MAVLQQVFFRYQPKFVIACTLVWCMQLLHARWMVVFFAYLCSYDTVICYRLFCSKIRYKEVEINIAFLFKRAFATDFVRWHVRRSCRAKKN